MGRHQEKEHRSLLLVRQGCKPVRSLTELRRRLAGTLKQQEFFVNLRLDDSERDVHFMMFVSGGLACISATDKNSDEWARSRRPEAQAPARGTKLFPAWPEWHQAERVAVHLGWTVPREDALLALEYDYLFGDAANEHYEEGYGDILAPWVTWEYYPHCRLSAKPGSARDLPNPFGEPVE
jgi:hypothetical protein